MTPPPRDTQLPFDILFNTMFYTCLVPEVVQLSSINMYVHFRLYPDHLETGTLLALKLKLFHEIPIEHCNINCICCVDLPATYDISFIAGNSARPFHSISVDFK